MIVAFSSCLSCKSCVQQRKFDFSFENAEKKAHYQEKMGGLGCSSLSYMTEFLHMTELRCLHIKLLESPIPTAAAAAPTASSQEAHFDDISGTKRGTIDPLVSKRPEKILNKKIQN